MSQKKSFPDMKEIMGFAGKFYNDMKKSVGEIIEDYKTARTGSEQEAKDSPKKTKQEKAKPKPTKEKTK